ncbi:MAG: hypothetical protein H6713_30720 [Myxococcales bacterium]|nr:hypothetical protein [Myxococcales bacterium]
MSSGLSLLPCTWSDSARALAIGALVLAGCGDSSRDSATDAGTTNETLTSIGPSTAGPSSATDDVTASSSNTSPTVTDSGASSTGTSDTGATVTTDDPSTTAIDPSTSSGTTDGGCQQGEIICEDGEAKVCDGMGGYESTELCPEECADGLGCVLCIPGSATCEGDNSVVCNDQGDGYEDGVLCDPIQGVSCNPDSGYCEGACSPQSLGLSYIGCDYYPTVTQQLDSYVGGSQYAVAVANTTAEIANVTITRGPNPVQNVMVQPGSVQVVVLAWVNELALGTGPTKLVVDGAYRLRSDRPVTVYQYNPLAANVTNDASLMLPVNAWTGNYVVAAWPYWLAYPGFYSVTAKADGTTVTLTGPPQSPAIQAGAGLDGNGNGVVMMDEGDVLQVVTANGGDQTGAFVHADKPVQVIGGHDCTQVPIGTVACDHLEESMFPIETLATEYIVVPPVQVPNDQAPKAQVVRVVATAADTQLTFEPDQGVNTTLAMPGQFVEIPQTTNSFKVSSNNKILVAQYMVGQGANFGTSDPAMLVAVATEQYRTNYLFHAPTGWSGNYVDIIAPDGVSVNVDGAPVMAFAPIGATGFSVAHVKLNNNGDGNHTVESAAKIGISVYGVLNYGSYWYPGGLDLALIPE